MYNLKIIQRRSTLEGYKLLAPKLPFDLIDGKTFQNRRVSSPAPVTIFLPQGLIALIIICNNEYLNIKLYINVHSK